MIFRVLKSDGDTFCILLGEDGSRARAIALARERHEAGDAIRVYRVLDSGIELLEASGYPGEDFMDV